MHRHWIGWRKNNNNNKKWKETKKRIEERKQICRRNEICEHEEEHRMSCVYLSRSSTRCSPELWETVDAAQRPIQKLYNFVFHCLIIHFVWVFRSCVKTSSKLPNNRQAPIYSRLFCLRFHPVMFLVLVLVVCVLFFFAWNQLEKHEPKFKKELQNSARCQGISFSFSVYVCISFTPNSLSFQSTDFDFIVIRVKDNTKQR